MLRRLLLTLALVTWWAPPSYAAVAYVQSKCFADNASQANVSVTLDAAVGSGNTVALLGLWFASTDTSTGATDDKSNTFTAGGSVTDAAMGGNGYFAKAFYKENITNAPITFTINFPAVTYRDICAMEISGVETTSVLRGSNQQGETGAQTTGTDGLQSATATVTAGDFVWGGTVNTFNWEDGTTYYTAGTGFTKPAGAAGGAGSASLYPIGIEYRTAASTGTIEATFTHGAAADDAGTFVMVFKAAAGGAAVTPKMLLLGVGGQP